MNKIERRNPSVYGGLAASLIGVTKDDVSFVKRQRKCYSFLGQKG
jgi:hypothetical protein